MANRSVLLAALAGGAVMYLFDPVAGRRRRALIRDKWLRSKRLARDELDTQIRDTANRARGLLARIRSAFDRRRADDRVLEQRIRAALGRSVGHAGAIRATVADGVARLEGPVLAAEADRVRRIVGRVRGVRQVDDRLEVHERADVPSLQGEPQRRPPLRLVPAGRLALGAISAVALIAMRPRPLAVRGWLVV